MDTEVKKQSNQSPISFLRSSLLYFAQLTPFMVLTSFLSFGFSPPFFTTTFLILSTSVLLSLTKKRKFSSLDQDSASMNHPPPEVQVAEKSQLEAVHVTVARSDEAREGEHGNMEAERQVGLQDHLPGSDGSAESENLGPNCMTPDVDFDQKENNTSSDSDPEEDDDDEEDGLIEIELPGCCDRNADQNEEAKRVNFGKPMAAESFLKQQEYLMELLAETNEGNEEENLIEIDISMGSIKCPNFEIQA